MTQTSRPKRRHVFIYAGIVVIILVSLVAGYYYFESQQKKSQQISDREYVIFLTNEAVNLIERKGEECFTEFRQKDSKWFHDDFYVFVWRTDGIRVVYPPDPAGEGEDMSDLKDINNKPIGQLFIDIAKSDRGEGWIEYQWPKPGEDVPSIKFTFIKRAEFNDRTYLVGSGYYE
jgi:signal transduction histidine kinase